MKIGTAIFLRHGQTNYTEEFPDITEEGKETIIRAAESILSKLERKSNLRIYASTKARARGSADILAEYFKNPEKLPVMVNPQLDGIRAIDPVKSKEVFTELERINRPAELAYLTDEIFDDPAIFEPRSQIRQRFYEYLDNMVQIFFKNAKRNSCFIHVTHYEILYHFVEKVFQLNWENVPTLRHGEIIRTVLEQERNQKLMLNVYFRGLQERVSLKDLLANVRP